MGFSFSTNHFVAVLGRLLAVLHLVAELGGTSARHGREPIAVEAAIVVAVTALGEAAPSVEMLVAVGTKPLAPAEAEQHGVVGFCVPVPSDARVLQGALGVSLVADRQAGRDLVRVRALPRCHEVLVAEQCAALPTLALEACGARPQLALHHGRVWVVGIAAHCCEVLDDRRESVKRMLGRAGRGADLVLARLA